tara:strand:+ start:934 stop:1053 length:120 start_codon:yes stop_codon:yes gene_type:complete
MFNPFSWLILQWRLRQIRQMDPFIYEDDDDMDEEPNPEE